MKVVLLGDSTLDNYAWVPKGQTVTEKLQDKLMGHEVVNLAVDGFTTVDVSAGAFMDKAVHTDRHRRIFFRPLDKLDKEQDVTHIVLSVGGNDIREQLRTLVYTNPKDREANLQTLLEIIKEHYIELLDEIRQNKPDAHLSIMLQYTPCTQHDNYYIYLLMKLLNQNISMTGQNKWLGFITVVWHWLFGESQRELEKGVNRIHDIMAEVYRPVLAYAQKHQIAIIDMPTSMDPHNDQLYQMQIEPSAAGGELIAGMITHTLEHHDFSGPPKLYAKPGPIESDVMVSMPLSELNDDWYPGKVYHSQAEALAVFHKTYQATLKQDKASWLGIYSWFAKSHAEKPMVKGLDTLVAHARGQSTIGSGGRTLRVMERLGWLNHDGSLKQHSGIEALLKESPRPK